MITIFKIIISIFCLISIVGFDIFVTRHKNKQFKETRKQFNQLQQDLEVLKEC